MRDEDRKNKTYIDYLVYQIKERWEYDKDEMMIILWLGIVFALILLSSITSKGDGKIPLTFIIVAIVYIGGQVYEGIFIDDNVSNLTHIVGGILGASFGHFMNKNKVKNA